MMVTGQEPTGAVEVRESTPQAIVSIHDVMPETMEPVGELIELAGRHGIERLTLLVVPGLPWKAADLDQLVSWCNQGCELAGHGWVHRCDRIRGIGHRLHSVLLSRNVAEHLALDSDGVALLIRRCSDWFAEQGWDRPPLYVPPAWALGRLRRDDLKSLPFAWIETLFGCMSTRDGCTRRLPLVGFEADTRVRAAVLRRWNRLNEHRFRRGQALRIAIHPHDHRLLLSEDLRRLLSRPMQAVSYCEVVSQATRLRKHAL